VKKLVMIGAIVVGAIFVGSYLVVGMHVTLSRGTHGAIVPVYNDPASLASGEDMISKSTTPVKGFEVLRYVACIVGSGIGATIDRVGLFTSDVTVTGSPHQGCHGTVSTSEINWF
jgi:uncharacterized membrane protein